jgi:3-isopropylmalate dehydratase small subunit
MHKFTRLTGRAAPFPQAKVDTDFIIRIERCTGTPKEELGRYAFEAAELLLRRAGAALDTDDEVGVDLGLRKRRRTAGEPRELVH